MNSILSSHYSSLLFSSSDGKLFLITRTMAITKITNEILGSYRWKKSHHEDLLSKGIAFESVWLKGEARKFRIRSDDLERVVTLPIIPLLKTTLGNWVSKAKDLLDIKLKPFNNMLGSCNYSSSEKDLLSETKPTKH